MNLTSPLLAVDLIRTLRQAELTPTEAHDPEISRLVAALNDAKARHRPVDGPTRATVSNLDSRFIDLTHRDPQRALAAEGQVDAGLKTDSSEVELMEVAAGS